MWLILLLIFSPIIFSCTWPKADVLFIIDSTSNVGEENFGTVKKFVLSVTDNMQIGESETRVALVLYTPKALFYFNLMSGVSKAETKNRIQSAMYSPCFEEYGAQCEPHASVNSIAKMALSLSSGNRQSIPDAIIVISSATQRIPELQRSEVLMAPISPTHAFSVSVGALDEFAFNSATFASTATTIKFSALSYEYLSKLSLPLCEAANDFISRDDRVAESTFGSAAITLIVVVIVIFLILLLMLGYALYKYRRENEELRVRLKTIDQEYQKELLLYKSGENGQLTNGYHKEMTENETENAGNAVLKRYDRRRNEVVPIDDTTDKNSRVVEESTATWKSANEVDRLSRSGTVEQATKLELSSNLELESAEKSKSTEESKATVSGTTESELQGEDDDDASEPDSVRAPNSYLASNHPARTLAPVDLLLLVDSSSSIGNANFEQMKNHINAFLNNVDIAPSRSRVAAIVFASEPSVCFGFNKFYNPRSVKAKIKKLPYIGGPTFLAKALLFASGVLYQEQNMKDGRHRKHKFMPTPRHDRLQVLVVVSDGHSEDNFDKVSSILHDKLHVKIAALVGKSFNREKLLPITRFEGAIFLKEQTEALSIWLWRQQRIWNENFGEYIEKEKSLPLDKTPVNSPKKKVVK